MADGFWITNDSYLLVPSERKETFAVIDEYLEIGEIRTNSRNTWVLHFFFAFNKGEFNDTCILSDGVQKLGEYVLKIMAARPIRSRQHGSHVFSFPAKFYAPSTLDRLF